ncbi:DEAD/DEAH box helicase family protein [Virgibacillus profundi]|uniref:DEAD/DEAH box helicase family protein n=1 Tax=Virgibacillus profundi TaxID=2024555 RepID=UPI00197E5591|nr:DEAD/DEAH box helicase family protein [Virgibacillus profundi]
MKVSNLITNDDIQNWENGDVITIKAGTGKGKSYFIKNNLYNIAKNENKKILMLIHRKNCVYQFEEEIHKDKKYDVIDIKTYQHLEHLYSRKKVFNFGKYDYIVCDEFHYFISDASFNKKTDISFNQLMKQKKQIKILMSATGDSVTDYINEHQITQTIDYEIPLDFSFVKTLTFYNKDETLNHFMQESIQRKERTIFFIKSAKKAYELYSKNQKNSLFNCSEANKNYYKFVDEEKINNLLKNESFDETALITTMAMDTGVNIVDKKLKHIVCDIEDIGVLIQCIGRKRITDKNDKINLYVKSVSNQRLGGMETQLLKKAEMAQYLSSFGTKDFIEEYYRENDQFNIVYDEITEDENKATKKINELMLYKIMCDQDDMSDMKRFGTYGFSKHVADILGFYNPTEGFQYRLIEEDINDRNLSLYLDSITGVKLYREEKEVMKETFKKNGLSARTLGINTLNGNIKDRKLPYIINTKNGKSYRDKNNQVKKEKSYWIVGKITFNEDCL